MIRLNVRCAAEPARVLGTVPVPMEAARRGSFQVARRETAAFTMRIGVKRPDSVANLRGAATILVREVGWSDGRRELAVFAETDALEFWREIPGFIAGRKVRSEL